MLCFKTCRLSCFVVFAACLTPLAHATVYYTVGSAADYSTLSKWQTASGEPCTAITDADELVCRNTTYYVKGKGTYPSKQLTIGEGSSSGRLVCDGHVTFANKGLFCQCGYAKRSGSNYNINGDVTITAPSDNPFGFYGDWGTASSCGIILNGTSGTLSAEKGTGIVVGGRMDGGTLTPEGSAGFRVTFNNYSKYSGEVTVLSSYDNAVCASGASIKDSAYCWGAALWLAKAELFPGSIRLCSGGGLYLAGAGETEVSNLTLEAGSTLRTVLTPASASCNSVRAEQLSVTGPVYISASYTAVATTDDSEISCKLLTAPAGVRLDPEDFIFVPSANGETNNETIPQRAHLKILTENGVDSLYIVVEPIVTLDVADSSERTAKSEYSSALMTPTSWSDQQLPHGGLVYRVAKNLRTTATGTEDPEGGSSGQDYVFPATEFFHDAGTFMLGGTRTITISNYVWRGGTIHTMQGSNPTLAGKMRIAESSATRTIHGWATLTLTIESDISGSGLITLDNVNTSSACAITKLAGDNTDFTGTFLLNNRYSSASLSKYVQLNFSEPRNLGGVLAEPDFRAIELRNYCKLNFLDDMTLDAASNRGIFSQTNGVLEVVEGKTATVRWPITLRGTLHKAGLGTLELSGALRFYDAATDSAVDERGTDSAVISLREGALRIGSAKSCDGATVSVLKDTSILLPVAEQGSELARLGLYDVKAGATPFALGTGVSELPISFAETAAVPRGCSVLTNALVTVANSAVESVRPMVSSLKLKPFGHKSSIVEIPVAGEDATTFACVTEVKGLILIFR